MAEFSNEATCFQAFLCWETFCHSYSPIIHFWEIFHCLCGQDALQNLLQGWSGDVELLQSALILRSPRHPPKPRWAQWDSCSSQPYLKWTCVCCLVQEGRRMGDSPTSVEATAPGPKVLGAGPILLCQTTLLPSTGQRAKVMGEATRAAELGWVCEVVSVTKICKSPERGYTASFAPTGPCGFHQGFLPQGDVELPQTVI